MRRYAHFIVIFLLVITGKSLAQDDDTPLMTDIEMNGSVSETITQRAFFDWWRLTAEKDDILAIEMFADEGLIPLLGLLDENGDIVAVSDEEEVAEVNGRAYMQFRVVTEGTYTIVATRDGRDQGTSTGAYRLSLSNLRDDLQRDNPYTETQFRCKENLLTTALVLSFREDYVVQADLPEGQVRESYRISVYGLDDFEPMIRTNAEVNPNAPLDCTDSATGVVGSMVDLPQLQEVYSAEEDDADHQAMVTLTNTGQDQTFGTITFTIGAKEDSSGRFIVVLEGLAIQENSDVDQITLRVGPFARDLPVSMYMIGNPDNRLDPLLSLLADGDIPGLVCDDAGRGDCSAIPVLVGSKVFVSDGERSYVGDRFDAGLNIVSDEAKPVSIALQSREYNTSGGYTLVFIAELPKSE